MQKLLPFFNRRDSIYVRNIDAGDYLENFLIASVCSVLAIRFYLYITGYPQIGIGHFHIAHMLWGGLLMMIAIFLLLCFLAKPTFQLAAVLGGIGFGTFIDELGKFITRDNNYFYQPTVMILYIIFILLFLIVKAIDNETKLTRKEYLMNALEMMKEVVLRDLDKEEKKRIRDFIRQSDHNDPVVKAIRHLLADIDAVMPQQPSIFTRIRNSMSELYQRYVSKRWFYRTIIGLFVLSSIINVYEATKYIPYFLNPQLSTYLSISQWGQLLFSWLSGAFVLLGIYFFRSSRLMAYELFKRSILISIFFTQVFIFYQEQFSSLIGLSADILILVTIDYIISQEKIIHRHSYQEAANES